MVRGKDAILELFDLHGMCHWKIYNKVQNGNFVASSLAACEIPSESRARLEQVLSVLQPSVYKIDFRPDLEKTKNFPQTDFEIPTPGFNTGQLNNSPGIGAYTPSIGVGGDYVKKEDIKAEVREMLKVEREREELRELRQKVQELEGNSVGAAIGKMLNDYGHVIVPMMASKFGAGPQVGLSGFPNPQQQPIKTTTESLAGAEHPEAANSNVNENDSSTALASVLETRMKNCLDKLILNEGSDEGAVILLEKLLLWIEQNPMMYASLKPTILNTQPKAAVNEN